MTKGTFYGAVAFGALIVGSAASADDLDADAEGGSGTIVVTGTREAAATASKTGTDPRDVPAALVVIPAEVLEQQNVVTLNDALTNASAVSPQFAGGYGLADNYVIRGLPMRFLRDGLPDGPSFMGYRRSLADVASIEVLKGPGSALYGRAEAGGSVNITTLAPQQELVVSGEASYGRFDSWALTADVTGGLAPWLSGRLIGHYERTDGYRGLARRDTAILPTAALELGSHHLTFDYDYRDQRTVVDNYGQPFTTGRTLAAIDPKSRFYSTFNHADQRIDRVTVADRFAALPNLDLRAALIYDKRSIDVARNAGGNAINAAGVMTGRNGRTQLDDIEYWTGQAEAVWRPVTGAIGHTVLFGAEYNSADISTVRRNYNLPNIAIVNGRADAPETASALLATTLAFDRRITSDTLSVYGQEEMAIGEMLRLRGGIRLDSVKLVDNGVVGAAARRIAGSNDLVSWQVGAVVKPAEPVSLYAGYARGKFIAIQTESTALQPIPESSDQIEAGVKTSFMDGRLTANLALFETKRDDFFVTLVAGADPVQVGRQKSRGVELDVTAQPLENFSLIGNLAYVDAINRSTALASVTGIATNVSTLGKRLAATPRWSGQLWGSYTVPRGALEGFTAGLGVTYKGTTFADALELLRVPSYTILRGALGYRTDHFDVQLSVANLTDKLYYSVPTFIGALPGEPRSFQLTLRTRL